MPRNGSGSYSIPNSFSPATTILSSEVNANNVDIAAALTASLCIDGQSAMTGRLRLFDGTELLPGLNWTNDTNTGLRRVGADAMALVAAGADVADITAAGVAVTGALSATGAVSGATAAITGAAAAGTLELGGATDATLARSGAGDLTVEGNAIYRAGGTDVPVADGGTGASTAAAAFTALKQAASDTDTGVVELAVQSEMEAASSALLAVTPGRQHFHPAHPKAFVKWSGATPAADVSHNVSSITDGGAGLPTINFMTAFSTANYAVGGSCQRPTTNSIGIMAVRQGTAPTESALALATIENNANLFDSDYGCAIVCGDFA